MQLGAFVCSNPECGFTSLDHYRYCPGCGTEKSLEWEENILLKRFIVNIFSAIDESTLNRMAETTGIHEFNLQKFFKEIESI